MNSTAAIPSLIHYLESDNAEFHVELSLHTLVPSVPGESHFPFLVVDESDPLASIFEASVVSDGGSRIRNVFLLKQKDRYHPAKDEVWPASNLDVDRAWQNLFSFLSPPGHGTIS